jgi:spermidine synthase
MGASDAYHLSPASETQRRLKLAALVVAWGIQAIVTQSILLREALVLMFGSEFAWGLVLFAWLGGVAVGATLVGRATRAAVADHRAGIGLVVVLLALGVASCVELWIFRGARAWLGVGPGELLPLPKTALAAVLFVSPVGALVGAAFPLACAIKAGTRPSIPVSDRLPAAKESDRSTGQELLSFGHVYGLESAGSLIGGAVFSFWAVDHLSPVETVLACTALTMAASTLWLFSDRLALRSGVFVGSVALAAFLVAVLAGDRLHERLALRRWRNVAPGYELLAEAESKYQNLAIGERGGQYTLYCDGHVTADFPDPYTYVPPAHFWMCQHPSPKRVLVLGGGAEGLLSELLRHPVEKLDYVEPDPKQVELIRPFLADVDRAALNDPRVSVHHVDARYFVKTQRGRFDLVIARLPEPISALHARFYTDEFYGELRRAMSSDAVLCMTAAAAPGELSEGFGEYLASIRATLRPHFPYITIGWGDPAQILAGTSPGLVSTDPAELARRYTSRGVNSALFHPAWFEGAVDWLEPDKLAHRQAELDAVGDVAVSTDLRPVIYVQRLELWEKTTGGLDRPATGVMAWLRSIGLGELVLVLAVVGAVTLIYCRVRGAGREGWASGAVVLSVGSTGFATMALSIIWLFAFQNLYGYVYQRIGWIIALFMAGLVIGCGWAHWRLSRRQDSHSLRTFSWSRLCIVDALLAILAASIPILLPFLGAMQSTPLSLRLVEWTVSIMVTLTGVLGGAAFPLAGRLQLDTVGRAGAAAGIVVGADHAGACFGALLCGILLVPVFGITIAVATLAATKIVTALLLLLAYRILAER